jgi:hypothetical protein
VRERERERKEITLDDGDTPGSTGILAVSRSVRAGLKKGAVLAVGK